MKNKYKYLNLVLNVILISTTLTAYLFGAGYYSTSESVVFGM